MGTSSSPTYIVFLHVCFSARAVFEAAREHQRKHAKIQGPVIAKSSQVSVPAQRQKGPCVFRKFTTFLTSPKLTAGSKFRRVRYRFHKEISENSLKKIAAPLRPYPCLAAFPGPKLGGGDPPPGVDLVPPPSFRPTPSDTFRIDPL